MVFERSVRVQTHRQSVDLKLSVTNRQTAGSRQIGPRTVGP